MPCARASSTLLGAYGSPLRNIWPESGLWKPQMILISVDFPAPLSPRRPSTSPLRRCRLMSRSAVTGPKRFVTCSTRRTSSGARWLSLVTSGTAAPLAHAADVDVDAHRDQDRQAEDEVEVVG